MPALVKLESVSEGEAREITRADSGIVTFGRESSNTICVESSAMSRRHGAVFDAGTQWFYSDFESTNGSWLNGEKLIPGETRLLRQGDNVRIADFSVKFNEVTASGSPLPGTTMVPSSLLVFLNGEFSVEIPVDQPGCKFNVGGPEGDIFVDNVDPQEMLLSINREEKMLTILIGQSSVPVSLNGTEIGGKMELLDRDSISVGAYQLFFSDPTDPDLVSLRSQAQESPAEEPEPEQPSQDLPVEKGHSHADASGFVMKEVPVKESASKPGVDPRPSPKRDDEVSDFETRPHMSVSTFRRNDNPTGLHDQFTSNMGLRFTQRQQPTDQPMGMSTVERVMLIIGSIVFTVAFIVIIMSLLD